MARETATEFAISCVRGSSNMAECPNMEKAGFAYEILDRAFVFSP